MIFKKTPLWWYRCFAAYKCELNYTTSYFLNFFCTIILHTVLCMHPPANVLFIAHKNIRIKYYRYEFKMLYYIGLPYLLRLKCNNKKSVWYIICMWLHGCWQCVTQRGVWDSCICILWFIFWSALLEKKRTNKKNMDQNPRKNISSKKINSLVVLKSIKSVICKFILWVVE